MGENQIEKKAPLLLPYVIEFETNKEVSVKDPLQEGYTYVCPFCRKEVSKKEGKIRRHHFFHLKDDYPCSATQESILHERAKNFIFNALNKKETFDITIKDLSLLSDQESLIPENLGITKITIKSDQIPATKYYNHEIEKTINQYDIKDEDREINNRRPDISSEDNGKIFAWEIFVKHAVDQEKKLYYESNKIPYIEIKPIALDKNYSSFEFELISYNGFVFSLLTKSVYDNLIANHPSEIFNIYRKEIDKQVFDNLKENAYAESHKKIEREKLNFKYDIINDYKVRIKNKLNEKIDLENTMREALCIIVKTEDELEDDFMFEKIEIGKWSKFEEAKICHSTKKNKTYISILDEKNNSYRINRKSRPENLLNKFIKTFYNYLFLALLDKSDKIIGFEIENGHTPKIKWFDSRYEVNKKTTLEEVKYLTTFKDGNNGYGMGSKFFKSELVLKHIIVNLLNQLHKSYECHIKPYKAGDKSPYVGEYLFKITDKNKLISTIMDII